MGVRTYSEFCRLTCLGGSERGKCECRGPSECIVSGFPAFKKWRAEAIARIRRYGGKDFVATPSRPTPGTPKEGL